MREVERAPRAATLIPLDEAFPVPCEAADFHAEDRWELRRLLSEALSIRERKIIALYYGEGLRMAEIGRVLGVSESRIAQVHGEILARLRRRMG